MTRAKMIGFGEIEVEGKRYDYDLVIDAGEISKRKKKGSKAFRADFGHTPLSLQERIPWGGSRLIVGDGNVRQPPDHARRLRGSRAAGSGTRGCAERGCLPAARWTGPSQTCTPSCT